MGYENEIRALEDAKKVVDMMNDGFPSEHRAEAERRLAAATARVERLKREADAAAAVFLENKKTVDGLRKTIGGAVRKISGDPAASVAAIAKAARSGKPVREDEIAWGGDFATKRKPGLWGTAVHYFRAMATFGYAINEKAAAEARAAALDDINARLQAVARHEKAMNRAMTAGDAGLDLGRALEKMKAKPVAEIANEIAAPQPVRAPARKIRDDDQR
jgi:transposase InsO family protein